MKWSEFAQIFQKLQANLFIMSSLSVLWSLKPQKFIFKNEKIS